MLGICATLSGISSCLQEERFPNGDDRPEEFVSVRIPLTRGSQAEEDKIADARIIVCRTTGQQEILANKQQSAPNTTFNLILPVGYVNLYLIANEQKSWDMDRLASAAQLKQKMQTYAAYPEVDGSHPVPMFGKFEQLYIHSDGTASANKSGDEFTDLASENVKRIFSKVTLALSCRFKDLSNGGIPVEVKSVSVKCMPKASYLWRARYTATAPAGFFDGAKAPATDYSPIREQNQTTGFSGTSTFYIPEYMVNDTALYTYLSVVVNVAGSAHVEKEYKLVIGDGLKNKKNDNAYMLGKNKTVNDLNITRNTHYIFNAKILRFDLSGDKDIEVRTEVVTWESHASAPDIPPPFNFTVSQSEFSIPADAIPYEGATFIDTDHPEGWSAGSANTHVSLDGAPVGKRPPGQLKFKVTQKSDAVIEVKSGNITKRIIIRIK
jgi:hypothetical protein